MVNIHKLSIASGYCSPHFSFLNKLRRLFVEDSTFQGHGLRSTGWVPFITWGDISLMNGEAEDGPHIQGVLNLLDNLEEDGGTQLVPGTNWNIRNCFHCCVGGEKPHSLIE